ncbi:hypothetical protein, partial [Streptococcus pneumoniae]|uniref:hypothetical protein n=1 Tax=Streptococcus pneumoniae TaxID=1313 RepID=UPI001E5AD4BD
AHVEDYTYRFIWCCYALIFGIKLYDEAKAAAAPNVPTEAGPEKFYLLSLKHSNAGDNMMTWWGKDSRGYKWDLGSAGLYDEKEAKETEA